MSFVNLTQFKPVRTLLRYIPVRTARHLILKQVDSLPKKVDPNISKQLLVDVSVIIGHDARTGVQRVVRGILLNLLATPPAGYRVCPVHASRKHGYRYASDYMQQSEDIVSHKMVEVSVNQGDIFLGLDLAANLLPLHQSQLMAWKLKGVRFHILVYDLLPLLHPEWFNPKTTRNFRRWMRTLALIADGAICISENTKQEFTDCLLNQYRMQPDSFSLNTIPLGMDIDATLPTTGLPHDIESVSYALAQTRTILMVGTIEPRKGHAHVLSALECIWRQGHNINLIIVGKPGWKTEAVQDRMRKYAKKQENFWWYENASDELLEYFYTKVDGVIVASKGEGFGLPLIEAGRHNKPVLVRDIPVFREIADKSVTFFDGKSPSELAVDILSWLEKVEKGEVQPYQSVPKSWQEVTLHLVHHLSIDSI